jgi:hypothetical protein
MLWRDMDKVQSDGLERQAEKESLAAERLLLLLEQAAGQVSVQEQLRYLNKQQLEELRKLMETLLKGKKKS